MAGDDVGATDTRPLAVRLPALRGIVHVSRDYIIDVEGRSVRFEQGGYGGPFVVGKRGDPLEKQPAARSQFWPAFYAWDKQGRRVRDGNVCVYTMPPPVKPKRAVELWRGNYVEVEDGDPRTDEQVRRAILTEVPAPKRKKRRI